METNGVNRHRYKIIIIGAVLAVFSWLAEAAVHLTLYRGTTLSKSLLPAVSSELWLRLIIALMIIAFSFYVNSLVGRAKSAKAQVEKIKNEWETTFDCISDPLLIHDGQFRITRCNRAYRDLAGARFKDIIGRPYYEVFPKMPGPLSACVSSVNSTKNEGEEEFTVPESNKAFRIKPFTLTDENGRYTRSIHVLEDITDRKRMEDELIKREHRYRALVEFSPDLICVHDSKKITYLNLAGAKMLGAGDPSAIIGEAPLKFVHPAYVDGAADKIRRLFVDKEAVPFQEEKLLRLDGSSVDVEIGGFPFTYEGRDAVQVIARDITVRKRAEDKIKRQLEQMEALNKIGKTIASSLDLDTTLRFIVDEVVEVMGADAADILLFNPAVMRLEYKAGRGYKNEAIRGASLRLGEGLAGKAVMNGRQICCVNPMNGEVGFQRAPLIASEGFVSYCCIPLVSKGLLKGAIDIFFRTASDTKREHKELAETIAVQAAVAIENAELFTNISRSNKELTIAYDTTIEGWSRALDLRDKETEGHSRRVTDMTVEIARAAGISEENLINVRRGALLHDIGKMGVPDAILLKPGPLTPDEWKIMKMHPVYARDLLVPIEYLRKSIDIPYCHHEKWDGAGYPRGIKGEEIPLPARIFSVVDVWDALRSDRPYRKPWTEEKAVAHIKSLSGKEFDPRVVEVFLEKILHGETHGGRGVTGMKNCYSCQSPVTGNRSQITDNCSLAAPRLTRP